jgi:fluoroquinolone transport system permease protein
MTLELGTLVAAGLAVPLALRRWWRVCEPAVVVGPLLLGGLVAAAHLPRRLVLLPATPLDPSWDAAHLRWSVLLLAALALLVAALADPATARVARRCR